LGDEVGTATTLIDAFDSGPRPSDGEGTSRAAAGAGEPADRRSDAAVESLAVGVDRQGGDAGRLGRVRPLARVALIVIVALAMSIVGQMVVVSALQHRSAQQVAFDKLRKQLAEGTAPLAQTDMSGRLLAFGTPVALIDIPAIHVHQVVLEGTTGGVLMSGPGHRRDTPLPGQAGTSAILGRAAAYGGPFKGLRHLRVGAKITVTTGEGVATFAVIGLRRAGDPTPPRLGPGKSRLLLITATGTPFLPGGVLRVDADLVGPTMGTPSLVLPANGISRAEQPMGTDTGTLWALVIWIEALIVVAVGIVWSWTRWGRHQTWIVFLPLTALIGYFVSNQFMRLMPNLL
jgi:sortase A